MQGEAEGPKWRPWAELLCLGSFNFLLGSSGLRLRERRQGVQMAFGTEALVTTQVPSFPWPMPPPTQPSSLPSALEPVPDRLAVLQALGLTAALSEVWLVGGTGVRDPGEPRAPSLGGLVDASACLVPWLLVPVASV